MKEDEAEVSRQEGDNNTVMIMLMVAMMILLIMVLKVLATVMFILMLPGVRFIYQDLCR